MLCGIEIEVANNGPSLASELSDRNLCGTDHLHEYHCRCRDVCDHDPARPYPWTAQQDCTASGEFISKPLEFNSPEFRDAIAGLSEAMLDLDVSPGRRGHNVGGHVHVDAADFGPANSVQRWRLRRLFLLHQDELGLLASGSQREVRRYNEPMRTYYADDFWSDECGGSRRELVGGWLRSSSVKTCEFRLWNSTRLEWRMHLHAGISVAMMTAALDWRNLPPVKRDDDTPLLDRLAPYMDERTAELAERQMTYAEVGTR
jgi:hypothetical protein